MALKGDLGSIDLAHVFQMLTMSQKTGTLEIHTSGGRKRLYFQPRGILYEFDTATFPESVARQLAIRPGIDDGAMQSARTHARNRGVDLLQALVELKAVGEEDAQLCLRQLMEEEIYDLFLTGDISFEFYEGERLEEDGRRFDESLTLSPNSLIMEAARRLDEWNFIQNRIPSTACIFEPVSALDQMTDTDSDCSFEAVYEATDGFRTISGLVEATGLPRYQVCRAMSRMAEQGVVAEVAPELLERRARSVLAEGRLDEGVAMLERAFDEGHHGPESRRLAGEANEKLGRFRKAALHLTCVADLLEEAGDVAGATTTRLQVRAMLPTHVEVRARLLHHFFDDPTFFKDLEFDPQEEAEQLAWMLQCVGREEEARNVLVGLHLRFQDDWRMAQRVSRMAVEMGAPKTAVQILLDSAEQFFSDRNWQQALRMYHRIRTIDPSHPGLDARIQQCKAGSQSSTPRVRPLLRRAVLFLVVGGAAGFYLHYNHRALQRFRGLDTEGTAVHGNFREALQDLHQFRAEFPGTVTALVASQRMNSLEDRERIYEEQKRLAREIQREDSARRQSRAERRLAEAQSHIRNGKYPEALTALREAAKIATDASWRDREQIDVKAAEISEYLDGSEQLFAEWGRAVKASDWEAAHRAGVALRAEFPLAPRAAEVLLPVILNTEPPGATLRWQTASGAHDPQWRATSPAVLMLDPSTDYQVALEHAGFQPITTHIQPGRQLRHSIRLPVIPARLTVLERKPTFPPDLVDGVLAIACDNGRLALLDLERRGLRWQQPLPDLQENASNALILGDRVHVAGTKGELLSFDVSSGRLLQRQPLPGRVIGSLVRDHGRLIVPLQVPGESASRLWCLRPESREPLWAVRTHAAITIAPVGQGRLLYVGLADGSVLHLEADTGTEVGRWTMDSAIGALGVGPRSIYVGSTGGVVREFQLGESRARWSVSLGGRTDVRALLPLASRLVVVSGQDLWLLDLDGGPSRIRREGWASGPVFDTEGRLYVAPRADSILELDENDLAVLGLYQADEALRFGCAGKDFPVLLSEAGSLYGLRAE